MCHKSNNIFWLGGKIRKWIKLSHRYAGDDFVASLLSTKDTSKRIIVLENLIDVITKFISIFKFKNCLNSIGDYCT